MQTRLNIGCGQTPTPGFKNYDNSLSVRLANSKLAAISPFIPSFILDEGQKKYLRFAQGSDIHWADAATRIPEPDRSVEVLYSSHMLEHLERDKARDFLKEARRVMVSGGIIRLAVPDISYHVRNYVTEQDADNFIAGTNLTSTSPRSLVQKVKHLAVGDRHHRWMYDGPSLCRLLASVGFVEPTVMEPGTTRIKDPGALNLREREPESVFVEALNP